MTLAGYSSTYFWYTDMLRSLFAKQLDVTNMGLFWQFAENDLLDGLYWETWYNKGYKKADVLCPDGVRATQPCKVLAQNLAPIIIAPTKLLSQFVFSVLRYRPRTAMSCTRTACSVCPGCGCSRCITAVARYTRIS